MFERFSAPGAENLQYRYQRHPVRRERIPHSQGQTSLLMTFENSSIRHFPQVTEEHSLGDLGNTLPQFVRSHRPIQQSPQDRALPSPFDNAQRGIDRAWRDLLLRDAHSFASTDEFVSAPLCIQWQLNGV